MLSRYSSSVEAAYQARKGDTTLQTGLDNNITLIKAKFPVSETLITWAQWDAARKELIESEDWYEEA